MTHRVLLVEDHELWRRQISSALQETPQWQVVGEASDGLEGVHKANALKPDLILLDVGLPTLNGLEAARQMLEQNPNERILFVSEQGSWDIAQAAMALGARGYVLKSDVGRDLPLAMTAVVEGRRFMSQRFAGRVAGRGSDEEGKRETCRHAVRFHADESSIVNDYARFAEDALRAGTALIVLAPSARREELHRLLQSRGMDVDDAIENGRYVSMDPADALPAFMVEGWPDEARFWKAASPLIMEAARASTGERPRVAACGECAPGLLSEGMAGAAVRLEQLWDDLTRTFDIDSLCAYSTAAHGAGDESHVVQDICAAHSAVHAQ